MHIKNVEKINKALISILLSFSIISCDNILGHGRGEELIVHIENATSEPIYIRYVITSIKFLGIAPYETLHNITVKEGDSFYAEGNETKKKYGEKKFVFNGEFWVITPDRDVSVRK